MMQRVDSFDFCYGSLKEDAASLLLLDEVQIHLVSDVMDQGEVRVGMYHRA